MVKFTASLFCVLAYLVLEGTANPIDIEPRSPQAVAAFGEAPVRRGADGAYVSTTSTSTSSTTIPSPSTAASYPSLSSSSSSSGGISLNGVSVPSFDSSKPFGISYSPYTSTGGCKDVSSIAADIQSIDAGGYQCVRLYGVDCNQVQNVVSALEQVGSSMKLFLGVYDLGTASSQASTMISALNGDWSKVITVSVGNEPVNDGEASVSTVVSTTNSIRSQLRAAGYNGPVVAVDTFLAIENNPGLCAASDYVAANAHAYFDGTVAASGAGAWVAQQASKLAATCPGKSVLITESGWPSAGNTNGAAVASAANQQIALSSILSSMDNKFISFEAFNDAWKAPGDLGVEQYWGILN